MALTNAQKQEAFRARMRKAGYRQVPVWVPEKKIQMLRDFVAKISDKSSDVSP